MDRTSNFKLKQDTLKPMDLSSHLAAELTLVVAILECLNVKCVCNSLKSIFNHRFKSRHGNSLIIGKYAGRKIWEGA